MLRDARAGAQDTGCMNITVDQLNGPLSPPRFVLMAILEMLVNVVVGGVEGGVGGGGGKHDDAGS